jgi:polar amino acid transport system substrate-binding protein
MLELKSKAFSLTRAKRRLLRFFAATLALCAASLAVAADGAPIPHFWDPQHRIDRPETSSIRVIRFVTEDDYPPFGFALPDGTLSGFNVDLARALCEELRVQCTVQARRWDTIFETIEQSRADAAVASIAMTSANRARVDFTAPYYKTPARFVARAAVALPDTSPEALAGKTVGVVARSAHEAYLRAFFSRVNLRAYDNALALRSALKRNEVEIAFGDGVAFALWLNGTDASACCAFRGGPYTESRFFGEGVGIALRRDNQVMKRALDYALKRVAERGVYADLYLKYFPVGFY